MPQSNNQEILDFRALFESAPGLYLVLTPDFNIVAVSNAYLEATMIGRQDILGRGIFDVFPDNPGDPGATGVRNLRASLERVKQFKRADTMAVQKYDIRRPESEGGGFEERYWSPLNSPVAGQNGQLDYIIHRVEDVTEFIRLKHAGHEREKMNQALRVRSEQMESEVYLRAQEVAQANRQLRAANEDLARLYDQIAQLMTQADVEFGRANIPLNPITPEDMLARIGRMIADHRRLDEQFRQAQKMEAVGQLAGGVAHDFNNLLTVIVGYANLVQSSPSTDNGLRSKMTEIQRAAEQAALLTGQLLAFSRKQPRQQRLLDLNNVIDDMQHILRRLIAEDIDLKFGLNPAGCPISADGNHLTQVLMNLVVNARDAMPIGGKLTIATRLTFRESEYSDGDGVRPAGRYAVLSVADTGAGMDAATLSRIFEPFFSTKGVGKGTGLGLSTVYGIVVQHGGWIEVESEPGCGTTFRIYLPAASGLPLQEVERTQAGRNGRAATILLVEDQAAVRLFAEEVLAEAGHKVLSAGNGLAALEVAARHNSDIDLLITDVVMPEMNGPELAARLTSAHPSLNVLYISGYTGSALMDRGLTPNDFILLKKPFLPESLVNKVNELLQRR